MDIVQSRISEKQLFKILNKNHFSKIIKIYPLHRPRSTNEDEREGWTIH